VESSAVIRLRWSLGRVQCIHTEPDLMEMSIQPLAAVEENWGERQRRGRTLQLMRIMDIPDRGTRLRSLRCYLADVEVEVEREPRSGEDHQTTALPPTRHNTYRCQLLLIIVHCKLISKF